MHSGGRCSDIYMHCPQSEGDHDNIQLSTPSGLHTASADGIWYVPVYICTAQCMEAVHGLYCASATYSRLGL